MSKPLEPTRHPNLIKLLILLLLRAIYLRSFHYETPCSCSTPPLPMVQPNQQVPPLTHRRGRYLSMSLLLLHSHVIRINKIESCFWHRMARQSSSIVSAAAAARGLAAAYTQVAQVKTKSFSFMGFGIVNGLK